MDWLFPYSESKLKPNLKMAVHRIQLHNNKKSAQLKHAKKEVAKLLADGKDEKARIRAEHIIREDFMIESYELLELLCELLHERVKYITSETNCPKDLEEAVSSIIWAQHRVDIPELAEVKSQFKKKYGSKFIKEAEENAHNLVNNRLLNKLSVSPPSSVLIVRTLEEIAKENNIEWVPVNLGLPECGSLPIASPIGFSVPMAPGSDLRNAYQKQEEQPVATNASSTTLPPTTGPSTTSTTQPIQQTNIGEAHHNEPTFYPSASAGEPLSALPGPPPANKSLTPNPNPDNNNNNNPISANSSTSLISPTNNEAPTQSPPPESQQALLSPPQNAASCPPIPTEEEEDIDFQELERRLEILQKK